MQITRGIIQLISSLWDQALWGDGYLWICVLALQVKPLDRVQCLHRSTNSIRVRWSEDCFTDKYPNSCLEHLCDFFFSFSIFLCFKLPYLCTVPLKCNSITKFYYKSLWAWPVKITILIFNFTMDHNKYQFLCSIHLLAGFISLIYSCEINGRPTVA